VCAGGVNNAPTEYAGYAMGISDESGFRVGLGAAQRRQAKSIAVKKLRQVLHELARRTYIAGRGR